MLSGLMMDVPLTIASVVDYAARWHGTVEIVSAREGAPAHRTTYAAIRARARRLGAALRAYGIRPGDRVATLAWNGYRHLELLYGISGIGAVAHTLNPRFSDDQLAHIVAHANDRLVFVDPDLFPILERSAPKLSNVEAYVVLADDDVEPLDDRRLRPTPLVRAPRTSALSGSRYTSTYESFLAAYCPREHAGEARIDDTPWPQVDERAAASLCYTSGTTGDPKGVLYSHRSLVLHALSGAHVQRGSRDCLGTIAPIAPIFHACAWGLPFVAPIVGATLVLPGRALDPESIFALLESEAVTMTAGIPTVWIRVVEWLRERDARFSTLRTLHMGGAQPPLWLVEALERDYDVEVLHGWGLTETSPVCTSGRPLPRHESSPDVAHYKTRAGRPIYGVEIRLASAAGGTLPHDGVARGELEVRGNWVASAYFDDEYASDAAFTTDGWFRTGDVASIDADGYVTLVDRAKDVIKSGGEWIGSLALEKIAAGHPGVAEVAAVGVPHPTWGERPILVVVRRAGAALEAADLRAAFAGSVPSWWIPDDAIFVAELPRTATGKISKVAIRAMLRERAYVPPDARPRVAEPS